MIGLYIACLFARCSLLFLHASRQRPLHLPGSSNLTNETVFNIVLTFLTLISRRLQGGRGHVHLSGDDRDNSARHDPF